MSFSFEVEKKIPGLRARLGKITTTHGEIKTPTFAVVGTKATVKALTPEQVKSLGAEVVLSNTYHLYLEPGDERLKKQGGLGKFMNWSGPTITDSGGFQVFSLGVAFGQSVSKIASTEKQPQESEEEGVGKLASIDDDGVTFSSHLDGSKHRFTPERSIEIQHNIGADIIFAFDECTSPHASYEYQKEAMERTHRWGERSLAKHQALGGEQALFGIVQGGRHRDLREESARVIGAMDFAGYGIGGSFDKEDMYSVVGWVNDILPENKPRHLLGIGEPGDIFGGIENGADLFDCVAPTRFARNGSLYTRAGRINIFNNSFRDDTGPIDEKCDCTTCANYSRAYLAHLFRAKEMLAGTLASVHNLRFIIRLFEDIRKSLDDGTFGTLKKEFLTNYYGA